MATLVQSIDGVVELTSVGQATVCASLTKVHDVSPIFQAQLTNAPELKAKLDEKKTKT